MERNVNDAWESKEMATSPRLELSTARYRALVLAIVLGVAFLVLVVNRLPVHSDDGQGTQTDAFDSPLLMWKFPSPVKSSSPISESAPGDLLTNGNMDQLGFYWRYPNHWIPGAWFEWFSTFYRIPEFNDGHERGFAHTYPSSQRLQLWGGDYAGGLMQSVTVTPCAYYQLKAYGQSRPGADNPPPVDVASHMKVGIEPYGWLSGRSICKYDPALEPDEFPDTVVWSPEATHNFTFAPYSVTAEALSTTVTAILFSNPEVDWAGGVVWNDTVWDTAALIQVSPPSGTILDGTYTPVPDGLITNLNVEALDHAVIIEWDTSVPASTQVVYRFVTPTAPISATGTLLFYSVYLPFVGGNPPLLDLYSPLDTTPLLHHRVELTNLPAGYIIDLAALSRRLEEQACVTSASSTTCVVAPGTVMPEGDRGQ